MRKTKKEDLRVIRTKKLIFTAFINLIQEKDYNSITVQDISDRAMINRSTFYSHFKDKQDVLRSFSVSSFLSVPRCPFGYTRWSAFPASLSQSSFDDHRTFFCNGFFPIPNRHIGFSVSGSVCTDINIKILHS